VTPEIGRSSLARVAPGSGPAVHGRRALNRNGSESDGGTGHRRGRLDVLDVRRRFSSLGNGSVFFDGPGGAQVPDTVIDAIAGYLRESNANVGGFFAASRSSEALVNEARQAAARFLGCAVDEVIFGTNMTTLNFALSRIAAREFGEGDEIVVTVLDHDANIAPWLELARDRRLVVRLVDVSDDTTLSLDDLRRSLSPRTRVVACPWASNAVGTLVDVEQVVELAHEAGALAWIDAVHFAPHGPVDVGAVGADVLLCSPYKFFGPHLGLAFVRGELLDRWRPYRIRAGGDGPAGHRYETGTLPHELLAGFVAAVRYVESVGFESIAAYERELGERFLAGLPRSCRLHGRTTMDGRVPTFALTFERCSPRDAAAQLARAGIAVWHGDFKAVEIVRRLGLEDGGALRIGLLHYNTATEVDRVLTAIAEL
jgi:cysteine desulfurase family protein (TIGR01976 family)